MARVADLVDPVNRVLVYFVVQGARGGAGLSVEIMPIAVTLLP